MNQSFDDVVVEVIEFIFHRYAPGSKPTRQQILNAINDYRTRQQ